MSAAYAQTVLQVNTTDGVVAGSRAPDGNYYAFYGIPYAGPTAGENRFKVNFTIKHFSFCIAIFYCSANEYRSQIVIAFVM